MDTKLDRFSLQNPYFRNQSLKKSEFNLQQTIVDEMIMATGITAWYIPKTLNNVNPVLGEDALSSFDYYFPFPALWINNQDFDGSQSMSAYNIGLYNNYNLQIFVSQSQWAKYADQSLYKKLNKPMIKRIENPYKINWAPSEGDLLVFKTDDNDLTTPEIWEIRYCGDAKMQGFGAWLGWEIYSELLTYTHEDNNTNFETLENLTVDMTHDLLDISKGFEVGATSDAYGDNYDFENRAKELLIPKSQEALTNILKGDRK